MASVTHTQDAVTLAFQNTASEYCCVCLLTGFTYLAGVTPLGLGVVLTLLVSILVLFIGDLDVFALELGCSLTALVVPRLARGDLDDLTIPARQTQIC